MIQLQTCLHAIKVLELNECEATAFGGLVLFSRNAHGRRRVLDEVVLDRLGVGRVRQVSYKKDS